MLFDLVVDPHEQQNLAPQQPDTVRRAQSLLDAWRADMLPEGSGLEDPLDVVMREGGPFHVRGQLPAYLARLRATGRAQAAEALARIHHQGT